MTAESPPRQSRLPTLLGTALVALLIGAIAVASARASLPSRHQPVLREISAAAAADEPEAPRPEYAFTAPLAGHEVNSPFGLRQLPWEEGGRLHQGVDIAAPIGTPVRATTFGLIVRSGVDGGYGRFVEVRHKGGFTSLYAHLGRAAEGMKRGALVRPGDVVGYVGSTGRSTGAHLHFEIRRHGRPLNPASFIDQQFATRADLPLKAAARVPRRVRIAQVSDWPPGVVARARASDHATIPPLATSANAPAPHRATPPTAVAAASAHEVPVSTSAPGPV
ncbi:MAG: M23 family metallopeptidase [Caulobacter sp.]|nr:M23 family metallopeptidase [Caulobacter sp.]